MIRTYITPHPPLWTFLRKWKGSKSSATRPWLVETPNYRMADRPPTLRETLEKAAAAAKEYLKFVYLGNI